MTENRVAHVYVLDCHRASVSRDHRSRREARAAVTRAHPDPAVHGLVPSVGIERRSPIRPKRLGARQRHRAAEVAADRAVHSSRDDTRVLAQRHAGHDGIAHRLSRGHGQVSERALERHALDERGRSPLHRCGVQAHPDFQCAHDGLRVGNRGDDGDALCLRDIRPGAGTYRLHLGAHLLRERLQPPPLHQRRERVTALGRDGCSPRSDGAELVIDDREHALVIRDEGTHQRPLEAPGHPRPVRRDQLFEVRHALAQPPARARMWRRSRSYRTGRWRWTRRVALPSPRCAPR